MDTFLGYEEQPKRLSTGFQMFYEVFGWCLLSSLLLYLSAAAVAFLTLRKHNFGRFYSLMILVSGLALPLTTGAISSASIAFVYKTSSFHMGVTHAFLWGTGITLVQAFFGATRILATL